MSEPHVPQEDARPGADRSAHRRADLALVLAAFAFGTTFLVVQDAVDGADPTGFLAVRFLLGGAVLAVVARRRRPRGGAGAPQELRHGVAAGLALTVGYVAQTVGLQYTTAATSAFLTYMLVVVVPLAGWVALGRRPHPLTAVGVGLAVAGLALLTGGGGTGFGRGEVLTLVCAVAFAVHIVILGEVAARHDPVRLTCVQLLTVGAVCLVPGVATGGVALPAAAVGAAVFTGVFATALAFLAMVAAQRVVSPARAALVLLLEPVFAALLDALAGAPLRPSTAAGGALILVAVVVAEVLPDTLASRRAAAGPTGSTGAAGGAATEGTTGEDPTGAGAAGGAGTEDPTGAQDTTGAAGTDDTAGLADTTGPDGTTGAEGPTGTGTDDTTRADDPTGTGGTTGTDTDDTTGADNTTGARADGTTGAEGSTTTVRD